MTPQHSFGVVVRSIGLLLLLGSLYHFLTGAWFALAAGHSLVVSSLFSFFLYSILGVLVSLYLLRGAPHLIHFCYPGTSTSSQGPVT